MGPVMYNFLTAPVAHQSAWAEGLPVSAGRDAGNGHIGGSAVQPVLRPGTSTAKKPFLQ